jgi:hypothetical protein
MLLKITRKRLDILFAAALLAGVAMTSGFLSQRAHMPSSSRPSPFCLDGVHPGMTAEETTAVLGPPEVKGNIPVKGGSSYAGVLNSGGIGSYAEYGQKRLTWDGSPTVIFSPEGRVISVCGRQASRNSSHLFRRGDSVDRLSQVMSSSPSSKIPHSARECIFQTEVGTLGMQITGDGRVGRMILGDPIIREPPLEDI